ncbi:hypothetical protein ACQF36_29600 [Streptomyces sp. Marseille-Q5077]|uniref:hypothetical protein n=1 Tax=Streptomyces sp. Marseille-Q5077 TaxID=3418995 RepID=UPI003D08DB59
MSDQHAATTLTAAAIITMILFARAAILHQGGRRHPTRTGRPPHRRPTSRADHPAPSATAPPDAAACAVREAEHHVHRCWQQLDTHSDPPQ